MRVMLFQKIWLTPRLTVFIDHCWPWLSEYCYRYAQTPPDFLFTKWISSGAISHTQSKGWVKIIGPTPKELECPQLCSWAYPFCEKRVTWGLSSLILVYKESRSAMVWEKSLPRSLRFSPLNNITLISDLFSKCQQLPSYLLNERLNLPRLELAWSSPLSV